MHVSPFKINLMMFAIEIISFTSPTKEKGKVFVSHLLFNDRSIVPIFCINYVIQMLFLLAMNSLLKLKITEGKTSSGALIIFQG